MVHDNLQVDIEGELKIKPKLRQTIDEEKVVYERLKTNDVANMKIEVQYDGTTREGLQKTILWFAK